MCYHPCEQACNRGKYDEAISIRAVERFLGDLGQALPKDVVQGWAAERQEGRRGRVRAGRAQRRVPTRAPRLRGHDPREIAQGRRTQSRRHSRLGAAAGRARSRDRAPGRARRHDQDQHRSRQGRHLGRVEEELRRRASWRSASPSPTACAPRARTRTACSTDCPSCATSAWARRR